MPPKSGGGRKRPQQQNAVKAKTTRTGANIQDFQFWKALAHEVVPGEKDEWKIGEVACLMQQFSIHIGSNYGQISKDIEETQKKSLAFAVPCQIDRANTPPEVFVGLKWSKKFGDGSTVKVPDPDQNELPLEVEDKPKRAPDEAKPGEGEGELPNGGSGGD